MIYIVIQYDTFTNKTYCYRAFTEESEAAMFCEKMNNEFQSKEDVFNQAIRFYYESAVLS